jgi:hypothetical protein
VLISLDPRDVTGNAKMVVGPPSAIRRTVRQTDLIRPITIKYKQEDSGPLAYDAVVTGKIVTDVSDNLVASFVGVCSPVSSWTA